MFIFLHFLQFHKSLYADITIANTITLCTKRSLCFAVISGEIYFWNNGSKKRSFDVFCSSTGVMSFNGHPSNINHIIKYTKGYQNT